MASLSFSLPFPPSVNGLFAGKARRYPSPAYKAWKAAAAPCVPAESIAGPYALSLILDRPDNRGRDLGNLEKAVSDLLVTKGVVADDRYCNQIALAWSDRPAAKGAQCHVTVTALREAAA